MDDELKSTMLERACDQNNSIMVECLLLLGADANQSKGATSLIYQVNIPGLTSVYPCYLALAGLSQNFLLLVHIDASLDETNKQNNHKHKFTET